VVHAPERTSASKSRLHFVRDQKHAVFVTELAEAWEEIIRRHNRAGLALNRFHDDGGDIVAYFLRNPELLLDGVSITERDMLDIGQQR
jgi:hypothetical protein